MGSIKIKGRWYEESSLTDEDKKALGYDILDEKAILKELADTPESVKKSHVLKEKSVENVTGGKVLIGLPSLKEVKKKKKGGK